MSVYRRYFRIASGELLKRAQELHQIRVEAMKKLLDFAREVGAENCRYSNHDGSILGFTFETGSKVDPDVWKKPNRWGAYMPKKTTEKGREVLGRMAGLPKIPNIGAVMEDVGLVVGAPALFDFGDRLVHYNQFAGAPMQGVFFIVVPWKDVDPAELEKYKKERESGVSFDGNMSHLLWTPHPDMVEVKEWEVQKELAELKEKLKEKCNG